MQENYILPNWCLCLIRKGQIDLSIMSYVILTTIRLGHQDQPDVAVKNQMCGFHTFWTNTAKQALSNIISYILQKQFLEKNI